MSVRAASMGSANRLRRRKVLMARYGRQCWLCGQPISKRQVPTMDHVMPKALGGTNALENLRLAHKTCNERRKDGPPPVLKIRHRDAEQKG